MGCRGWGGGIVTFYAVAHMVDAPHGLRRTTKTILLPHPWACRMLFFDEEKQLRSKATQKNKKYRADNSYIQANKHTYTFAQPLYPTRRQIVKTPRLDMCDDMPRLLPVQVETRQEIGCATSL